MLETLLIRAWHSEPGPAQQRAQRRLLAEQELVRCHFGDCPDSVPYESWPAVAAPVKLLRRAVRNGWFTAQQAAEMEAGEVDIPISVLCEAADIFGISVTELLTGDRAKLKMYSVVRKGRGIGVERTAGYSYSALAHGFADRKVEPLLVTIPFTRSATAFFAVRKITGIPVVRM